MDGFPAAEQPPAEPEHSAVPLAPASAADADRAISCVSDVETVHEEEREQQQPPLAEALPAAGPHAEQIVEAAPAEVSPGSKRRLDFTCPVRMLQPPGAIRNYACVALLHLLLAWWQLC